MRQSTLFTKTRREAPKDEVSKNAQLLIRAGFINKEMAGVYDFLPLGLITLNKVIDLIRKEMNSIGGQEVSMSSLQRKELWEKTDRWDDEKVDAWFKTRLKDESEADGGRGKELGLAFTHEEPVTNMMEQFLLSYKDLPKYLYQFQTKFRNETRAKSGLMRTREFIMKDLYSFSESLDEHSKFYNEASDAYQRIFEKVGLGNRTYKTFASGGSFSAFSHEFQTECEAGEDIIYVDDSKKLAINKEILGQTEMIKALGVDPENLREAKAVEVGNIFTLGTRFSDALNLMYKAETGNDTSVFMGSYGIGPARLMATIVEVLSDEKGLVWPESVAPFRVHLVSLANDNDDVIKEADELYRELSEAGVEVLYDDRDARAGEKFADSDLIGIPLRIVVSQKSLAAGKFECVERQSGATHHKSLPELIGHLTAR